MKKDTTTKDDTMTNMKTGKFILPSADMINEDTALIIESMESTYEGPRSLQIKLQGTMTLYAYRVEDLKQTARDNATKRCIELGEEWPTHYHIDKDRLELHIQNMERMIHMRTDTYTG